MLKDYWETKYKRGDCSGHGSIGEERDWKWAVIRNYIDIEECSVLDLGCGDLNFWGKTRPRIYVGVDYSKTIIERNRVKFPDLIFVHDDLTDPKTEIRLSEFDVVFCLDVLFHQPSERNFLAILEYLNGLMADYLFITNFDIRQENAGGHMSFRDLMKYLDHLSNWLFHRAYESTFASKSLYVFIKRRRSVRHDHAEEQTI